MIQQRLLDTITLSLVPMLCVGIHRLDALRRLMPMCLQMFNSLVQVATRSVVAGGFHAEHGNQSK